VLGQTTQPVEQYGSYDVVFLAPDPTSTLGANNLQGLMHVRYCLNATTASNETLWFQTAPASYSGATAPVVPSTSSCPGTVGAGAWSTKQEVAKYLVNRNVTPNKPLFIATPDSSGAVGTFGLDAFVDVDPTGGAPASELQTSLTLRNLNHPPVATMSCTAAGNGHVTCDASASTDADGQTLSYSWKVDGVLVSGQTSYRLDQSFTAGTAHTFQVLVQDTGGAQSSSATQTVTAQ
jgi:hypothetical protein